jgi:hypothetical protein
MPKIKKTRREKRKEKPKYSIFEKKNQPLKPSGKKFSKKGEICQRKNPRWKKKTLFFSFFSVIFLFLLFLFRVILYIY